MFEKNEAVQLHRQGQLLAAKAKYEAYLALHPDDADVCHAYGVLLGQSGDYLQAQQSIEKAITLKSNQASYYNSLGNVYAHREKIDRAIHYYQIAIKKQPSYPSAYNNLGRMYMRQNKLSAAVLALQKAIALRPDFAEAHCNLGILYVQLSDDDNAIIQLEAALKINPNGLTALRQLSDIYSRHQRFVEALPLLKHCLTLSLEAPDDYYQLGIVLFQLKQYEEAIAAFEQVLQLNSKHPLVNQSLANALLRMGDHEKALTYYFRQLANQRMLETLFNIGVIFMWKDRLQDALHYFAEAEKCDPLELSTQLNMGSIYLKQRHLPLALSHYQKAAQIKPNDPEIEHIVAALSQNKMPQKAPRAYLQHLFDHYAPYYDKHLTTCLRYDTPAQIHTVLQQEMDLSAVQWRILDIGCGTGLAGAVFKPYANTLIGVDLSEKMLAIAAEKKCYDELIQEDIETALCSQTHMDLVIAADVFTYIGDLSIIFERVHHALNTGGLFAFTVEKTFDANYLLQTSIRYAHSKQYLYQLIDRVGFAVLRFDDAVLRQQENKSVEGYLVLLEKI